MPFGRASTSVTSSATVGRLSRIRPLLTASLLTMLLGSCNSEAQLPAPAPKEIGGGTLNRNQSREFIADRPHPDFPALVRESDTIVVATIKAAVPVATREQQIPAFPETDYHVAIEQVIRQKAAPATSAGDTVVVRRVGGTTTGGGVRITTTERGFPLFAQGERYVLFLQSQPDKSHLTLSYGPQGTFAISSDNTVRQVDRLSDWNRERGAVSLQAFLAEVQTVITTSP